MLYRCGVLGSSATAPWHRLSIPWQLGVHCPRFLIPCCCLKGKGKGEVTLVLPHLWQMQSYWLLFRLPASSSEGLISSSGSSTFWLALLNLKLHNFCDLMGLQSCQSWSSCSCFSQQLCLQLPDLCMCPAGLLAITEQHM